MCEGGGTHLQCIYYFVLYTDRGSPMVIFAALVLYISTIMYACAWTTIYVYTYTCISIQAVNQNFVMQLEFV